MLYKRIEGILHLGIHPLNTREGLHRPRKIQSIFTALMLLVNVVHRKATASTSKRLANFAKIKSIWDPWWELSGAKTMRRWAMISQRCTALRSECPRSKDTLNTLRRNGLKVEVGRHHHGMRTLGLGGGHYRKKDLADKAHWMPRTFRSCKCSSQTIRSVRTIFVMKEIIFR